MQFKNTDKHTLCHAQRYEHTCMKDEYLMDPFKVRFVPKEYTAMWINIKMRTSNNNHNKNNNNTRGVWFSKQ